REEGKGRSLPLLAGILEGFVRAIVIRYFQAIPIQRDRSHLGLADFDSSFGIRELLIKTIAIDKLHFDPGRPPGAADLYLYDCHIFYIIQCNGKLPGNTAVLQSSSYPHLSLTES